MATTNGAHATASRRFCCVWAQGTHQPLLDPRAARRGGATPARSTGHFHARCSRCTSAQLCVVCSRRVCQFHLPIHVPAVTMRGEEGRQLEGNHLAQPAGESSQRHQRRLRLVGWEGIGGLGDAGAALAQAHLLPCAHRQVERHRGLPFCSATHWRSGVRQPGLLYMYHGGWGWVTVSES